MGDEGGVGLILVVEDGFGLCDLVTTVLELDSTVTTAKAADGEHALEMVRTMRPGLVVLDTRPPKLGGLEVARQLKADPTTQAIPVVCMTSGPPSELTPGVCDYHLNRPYDLAEVVEGLRRRLASKTGRGVAA